MATVAVPDNIRTKAVAAAQAVYRLSGASPFDPALAFSLRRTATEVITAVAALGVPSLERRASEAEGLIVACLGMQELLRFARELGQVSAENTERVRAAYAAVSEWASARIGPGDVADDSEPPADDPLFRETLNDRQRRIIAYVSSSGRVSSGALLRLFGSEVSEKTIRRDLWELIDAGLLRRVGDNRWTMYVVRQRSQ